MSASTVSADASTGRQDSRRWWALVAVSLAAFMTYLDGYHTGLLVTIALMAVGVVVSYLTLRPRAGAPSYVEHRPAAEITAVGELEAIGESLGELVVPARPDR